MLSGVKLTDQSYLRVSAVPYDTYRAEGAGAGADRIYRRGGVSDVIFQARYEGSHIQFAERPHGEGNAGCGSSRNGKGEALSLFRTHMVIADSRVFCRVVLLFKQCRRGCYSVCSAIGRKIVVWRAMDD